jgi:hypothetical protein
VFLFYSSERQSAGTAAQETAIETAKETAEGRLPLPTCSLLSSFGVDVMEDEVNDMRSIR